MTNLTLKDQGLILQRISDMLYKGFTMGESLDFLGRTNEKHINMFHSMTYNLQSGQPIYEVFYQEGFDHQICTQLYLAEKHGFLDSALKQSGEYVLKKAEQRKKMIRLLQYPVMLLVALLTVSILLQTLLLPRFQMFYHSMGYQPAILLRLFLHMMQTLPLYSIVIVMAALAGGVFLSRYLYRKSALERALFYSGIPIAGTYYKLYQTIFLAREWSFLLSSGFSVSEIVYIMRKQELHPLMKESAAEIKEFLTLGYTFSEAVSHLGFVEEELIVVIAHGEKNGKLDGELMFYSQFCLQRLEEKITKVFLMVQPALFVIIGFVVIAIYLSIFLPMFQVIDSI
ncbi:competence type IV pilus assembly protein ComGB [Siminovitchia sediminis]|uniref:Competence type IV pilus assembly protein ComGB n=2 Tax=Siminovitchia sediminis TaxID=1274353 RepID=A0ABW4KC53_9BACI